MEEMRLHTRMRDRAADLPPAAADLLERATDALDQHNLQAAETTLAEVLALVPDCTEALRLQGLVWHVRGDYRQAVERLRQVQARLPDDPLVRTNLATALYASGQSEEALSCLQQGCAMAPDFAPAWYNLGKMYMLQDRPAGAVTALHRALDLEPEHVPARMQLARAEASLGAMQPASENYREVLRLQPDHADAWIGLADLDVRFRPDDVAQLQRALQSPGADQHARICFGFALVRALEDVGDFPEAFRALRKANGMMHRLLRWNAVKATTLMNTLRELFAHPLAPATDASLGHGVTFVVGMPQAGSLLTGQILAAHPTVAIADELSELEKLLDADSMRRQQPFWQWMTVATPAQWQGLGEAYLARIEPLREGKAHFVDRTPGNWRLVGAIAAMLPGARVVNSRRGALETCFSCYRQLFVDGHEFSYDLDHVVSYWSDYDRLCRHWRRTFPASFLDHDHEAWDSDPAPQVRRLLDFCGLPFDQACLDVHRAQRVERAASSMPAGQLIRQDALRCAAYGEQLNRLRGLLRMRLGAD